MIVDRIDEAGLRRELHEHYAHADPPPELISRVVAVLDRRPIAAQAMPAQRSQSTRMTPGRAGGLAGMVAALVAVVVLAASLLHESARHEVTGVQIGRVGGSTGSAGATQVSSPGPRNAGPDGGASGSTGGAGTQVSSGGATSRSGPQPPGSSSSGASWSSGVCGDPAPPVASSLGLTVRLIQTAGGWRAVVTNRTGRLLTVSDYSVQTARLDRQRRIVALGGSGPFIYALHRIAAGQEAQVKVAMSLQTCGSSSTTRSVSVPVSLIVAVEIGGAGLRNVISDLPTPVTFDSAGRAALG